MTMGRRVTGKIISCSGCQLNSMKELKSFLMDFEAEEYAGVDVEYVHGHRASISIYHDGELQETISLHDYPTKQELHMLMVTKGFVKKVQEEIQKMKALKRIEQRAFESKRNEEKVKRRIARMEQFEAMRRSIPATKGDNRFGPGIEAHERCPTDHSFDTTTAHLQRTSQMSVCPFFNHEQAKEPVH